MVGQGLGTHVSRLCALVARLAKLNVCWCLASLCGAVVLGVFPATWAMVSVLQEWRSAPEEADEPVRHRFLRAVRFHAVRANLYGWAGVGLVGVLLINLQLATQQPAAVALALRIGVGLAAGVLVVTVTHLPLVSVLLAGPDGTARPGPRRVVSTSLWFGLSRPLSVVAVLAAAVLTAAAVWRWPGLGPFFCPVLVCWLAVTLATRSGGVESGPDTEPGDECGLGWSGGQVGSTTTIG